MRTANLFKRFTAAFAAVCASVSVIPVCAEDSEYETVYISSAADLAELSELCVSDTYSENKYVILKNDIDLSGSEFEPIPVFCGIFDGNGRKISGFSEKSAASDIGIFAQISESGTVKHLTVSADIRVKSSSENSIFSRISFSKTEQIKNTAAIAAVNSGTIINCTAEGNIAGTENVGGIAGENRVSGRIESCENRASLSGETNTGGIVGNNAGRVTGCKNNGSVNENAPDSCESAGGIAGTSSGYIERSDNSAPIGSKHVGTGVGGIAGSQSGSIFECVNTGKVLGKTAVGGIAGIFEPYTDISFERDTLQDRAASELDKMDDNLERLDNIIKDRSGVNLGGGLSGGLGDGIADAGESVANALEHSADGAVSAIDESLSRLNGIIEDSTAASSDRASEIVDVLRELSDNTAQSFDTSLSSISDSLTALNSDSSENIRALTDDLSSTVEKMSENSETLTQDISSLADKFEEAISANGDDMDRLVDGIIKDLSNIRNSIYMDFDVDLDRIDKKLSAAIEDLNDEQKILLAPLLTIMSDISDLMSELDTLKEAINTAAAPLIEELEQRILEGLENSTDTESVIDKITEAILPDADAAGISSNSTLTDLLDLYDEITERRQTPAPSAAADTSEDTLASAVKKLLDVSSAEYSIPREIGGGWVDMAIISYCANSAYTEGIDNVGGIVGAVDLSDGILSSDSVTSSGDISLNPSAYIKAVIDACINEGGVYASGTGAGGIAGFAAYGTIRESLVECDITSDGGTAGGIAGTGENIYLSAAICNITASDSAGGIAGTAENIAQCYALPIIDTDGKIGAIAASVTGTAENNYFIREGLGGIGGADVVGAAEALYPSEMTSDSSLPSKMLFDSEYWHIDTDAIYLPEPAAFAYDTSEYIGGFFREKARDICRFEFKAEFVIDGEIVKSETVGYGTVLDDIPKIPNGYAHWDKDTGRAIIRNTVFTAVYDDAARTLSWGGDPPLILAEGMFDPNTTLDCREVSCDDNRDIAASYAYALNSPTDTDLTVTLRVRIDDPDTKYTAAVWTDGEYKPVDTQSDGHYVLFSAAESGKFIVYKNTGSRVYIICGAAAGVIALAAVAAWRWKRRVRG